MDFINSYIPENMLHALGWTVVHSMWQAFAIALLLSAYLLSTRASARHRYIAGLGALCTMLAASFATFFIIWGQQAGGEVWSTDGMLLGTYWMDEIAHRSSIGSTPTCH